jgi:hypothetical protein
MKKELKNYRIVSENGEAMLISRESFRELLETLDLLASRSDNRPQQEKYRKKS